MPFDGLRKRRRQMQSSSSFVSLHSGRQKRRVYANIPLPPVETDAYGYPLQTYAPNMINTSKYTLLTFLPKNLFEQLHRVANIYFIGIVILQCFPIFGSFNPYLSAVPIITILLITAAKDGYEDYKRHTMDNMLNNSITYTIEKWNNTNVSKVRRSFFQSIMHSISSAFGSIFRKKSPLDAKLPSARTGRPRHGTAKGSLRKGSRDRFSDSRRPSSADSNRLSGLYITNGWRQSYWKDVHVGEFVLLRDNDSVPADMIVLASSEDDGTCYIETKNLDGETNLKARQALKETKHIQTVDECRKLRLFVDSEPPLTNLYVYSGAVVIADETVSDARVGEIVNAADYLEKSYSGVTTVPVNISNMLLRGCIVRNTEWVIGFVVFTGKDTKVMLNSGPTPSKRSRIDVLMNPQVLMNFAILGCMCVANAVANYFLTKDWLDPQVPFIPNDAPELAAFYTFFAALIIYQNIVPISLYISVEFVKSVQAYFIYADNDLYWEETNTRCKPKTWNISDDLGQIEYVFSDKTGTLTQNKMEYRRCSINGIVYGNGFTDVSKTMGPQMDEAERQAKVESWERDMRHQLNLIGRNKYMSEEPLPFLDPGIVTDLKEWNSEQSRGIYNFFSLLAVCHTVLTSRPDEKNPNRIVYKAQSPDEHALVTTAKDMGFVFLERTQTEVIIEIFGEKKRFELLNTIEFNSTRKRMSTIVKTDKGEIMLLCKGADSMIYERLAGGQDELKDITLDQLAAFANEGLRTLCLAYRIIPEPVYKQWAHKYHIAATSLVDREKEMDLVAEEIETDLVLIGATAIEDKLQEDVPKCIALLRKAGIKVWVLTGDKMETAINIGFACNLLSKEMSLIVVQGKDVESVTKQIDDALVRAKLSTADGGTAENGLVIDGESLRYALEAKEARKKFLDLGTLCKSVVCCRVSPKQKAQVVRLVKTGLKAMCLSIGDGANDVSMIQEANVGVGIAGQEGLQAAMSSDYVISQFKFLSKLLLVHGRWSYLRISEMILNFWYKNVVWVFAQFWYQFYTGFSADVLYDYTFVMFYNLVFTVFPVLALGIFDQDVNDQFSLKVPQLYGVGIKQTMFNFGRFWLFVLDGVYQSAVCFFLAYFTNQSLSTNGDPSDKLQLGTAVAAYVIVSVNLYVGLNIRTWTWIVFVVIIFSICSFLVYVPVYAQLPFTTVSDVDIKLFAQPIFWLCFVLVAFANLLPKTVIKYLQTNYWPADADIVREVQKYGLDAANVVTDLDMEEAKKKTDMSEGVRGGLDFEMIQVRKPSVTAGSLSAGSAAKNGMASISISPRRVEDSSAGAGGAGGELGVPSVKLDSSVRDQQRQQSQASVFQQQQRLSDVLDTTRPGTGASNNNTTRPSSSRPGTLRERPSSMIFMSTGQELFNTGYAFSAEDHHDVDAGPEDDDLFENEEGPAEESDDDSDDDDDEEEAKQVKNQNRSRQQSQQQQPSPSQQSSSGHNKNQRPSLPKFK